MLEEVEWGEFRIGDLFDISSTLSFNTDKLTDGNEYDYVTRTSFNQGILKKTGFVNKENINDKGIWSLGLLQMDFFYRKNPWYAGQFVRKIIPKIKVENRSILFFTTIFNMQKPKLLNVLIRNVDETFLNIKIKLPTKNSEIDFEFMESFVAEIEAQRVSEIEAYLTVTGLKDYELTNEEKESLENFFNLEWGYFKMGDLFNKVTTKKLSYKAKELPKEPTDKNTLPVLTSSFMNQGLNYYVPTEGATILKNVISIPQNSDVYRAYYQSRDFSVLSDAYAIEWESDEVKLESQEYLFMVSCINKVTDLPIYSYKNKLGGWNVVKEKYIKLPINLKNEIDFKYMKNLILAIQKLVIKDVILFSGKKIEATKKLIGKTNI